MTPERSPSTAPQEGSTGSEREDGQNPEPEPAPAEMAGENVSTDSGPTIDVWHIWRGSPQLLAHAIRVAERATSATTTSIEVAVDRDFETFSSPKAFVEDVTLDALRRFSWIAASASGPEMKVQILLGWRSKLEASFPWRREWGDADVAVIVVAQGSDSAAERSAVDAVHAALQRGGTDRVKRLWIRLRLFQSLAVLLLLGIYIAISVLVVGIRADTPSGVLRIDDAFAAASTDVGQLLLPGLAGVLAIVVGAWVGRRAYPALEVAERGETRIVRASRWLGATALSLVVAAVAKVLIQS